MVSVQVWRPKYSNVLSLVRPLPAVYCQWVPISHNPPVGYPGITRWVGVVPESSGGSILGPGGHRPP